MMDADIPSETVKSQIKNSFGFLTVVRSYINTYGATFTALSASYTIEKTFEGNLLSHIAYLYLFEKGTPIIVIFEPLSNQLFKATGLFLFGDYNTFLNLLLNYESIGFKTNLM